jgi:hypothetical protein
MVGSRLLQGPQGLAAASVQQQQQQQQQMEQVNLILV